MFVQPPAPNFLPSDICTYNGYTYEYFVCRNRDCAAKGVKARTTEGFCLHCDRLHKDMLSGTSQGFEQLLAEEIAEVLKHDVVRASRLEVLKGYRADARRLRVLAPLLDDDGLVLPLTMYAWAITKAYGDDSDAYSMLARIVTEDLEMPREAVLQEFASELAGDEDDFDEGECETCGEWGRYRQRIGPTTKKWWRTAHQDGTYSWEQWRWEKNTTEESEEWTWRWENDITEEETEGDGAMEMDTEVEEIVRMPQQPQQLQWRVHQDPPTSEKSRWRRLEELPFSKLW